MQKSIIIIISAILAIGLTPSDLVSANSTEEGVIINLRRLPAGEDHDSPRSLTLEAYFDSDLSSVGASLNGAGTLVDVYIENFNTEEDVHYQIPGNGNAIMPISGTSGCWRITFVLSNGDEYIGDFYII